MASPLDRVPLVIGVTGHRDLRAQDVPRLEREVGEIITRLQRDYIGPSHDTPMILISALAEGADSVVARVALALGVRLIAPLPLPIAEYRRDFESGLGPRAAVEFDELLSQSSATLVLPFTAGNSLEVVRSDLNKRAEQYRAVGLFIVQHCDVLIALWDGNENDKAAGGTSEVVQFKREGIPLTISGSSHASLDGSEIGPVIHVVTPRRKAGSPASDVSVRPWGNEIIKRHRGGVVRRLSSRVLEFGTNLLGGNPTSDTSRLQLNDRRELEAWETFDVLVKLTREFNREVAGLMTTTNGSLQTDRSIDGLFTDPDNGHIDRNAKQRTLAAAPHWCELYAVADVLAQNRQTQFKNDWSLLFVLGFVAFFFFAMFSHVGKESNWLLGGYTLVVTIVFCVFLRAYFRQDQERFLDYRALAEALRVAVYWNILGIDRRWQDSKGAGKRHGAANIYTIGLLASCYPIKQPSELAWIKLCLRTLELWHATKKEIAELEVDSEAYAITRRFWVCGQLSYFEHQGTRHNRRAEVLEGWAIMVLFFTSFFLVPLLISAAGEGQYLGGRIRDVFLIAIGILPGLAATLTSYSERLAFKAQARQYNRMSMLFKRAYDLLPEIVDDNSKQHVQSLYLELGTEAMKENADWVAIYRQRPIRPVQ
jgi:hypothetical protein